jgi:hypothetical protein
MEGYQIRVLQERGELASRMVKLKNFLAKSTTINPDERDLL